MTKRKLCINKDAKETLKKIWEETKNHGVTGRCSGFVNDGKNTIAGSHITLVTPDEVVTIFQKGNEFNIIQYKRANSTHLGRKIMNILKKAKLPFNIFRKKPL